jgi:Rrf2 family iron-sulfur cluster assembly transcriptional regulator
MQSDPPFPRLSSAALYATRAMIELASAKGCRITSAVIESRQQLPGCFLDQLLARLRRAGLVVSTRGPHGGYALRRASHSITLADIVAAVNGLGPQDDLASLGFGLDESRDPSGCAIQEAWSRAAAAMLGVMDGITLDMLVQRQLELADTALSAA